MATLKICFISYTAKRLTNEQLNNIRLFVVGVAAGYSNAPNKIPHFTLSLWFRILINSQNLNVSCSFYPGELLSSHFAKIFT